MNENWQPISTAPKDGTEILAYSSIRKTIHVISWVTNLNGWVDGDAYFEWDFFTHWMLLPLPPSPEVLTPK